MTDQSHAASTCAYQQVPCEHSLRPYEVSGEVWCSEAQALALADAILSLPEYEAVEKRGRGAGVQISSVRWPQ